MTSFRQRMKENVRLRNLPEPTISRNTVIVAGQR